jgi:hypothetical protein
MNTARNWIATGTRVSYQYRTHPLLGGELVIGVGTVTGRTVVGVEDAYTVKPDSGDTVHVRFAGVRAA